MDPLGFTLTADAIVVTYFIRKSVEESVFPKTIPVFPNQEPRMSQAIHNLLVNQISVITPEVW